MVKICSWGRLSQHEHSVVPLNNRTHVANCIKYTQPGLAYGMGRSYGDACLNPKGNLWLTRGLDRFIAFDDQTGLLVCEAGVLLRDIQRLMIPRGWMLPVTPGTQMVTVGGAIANDVHGKNHHVLGTFGNHIQRITLMRTDGEIIECGPNLRQDWFTATIGGIGLTGVISEVEIQLRRTPSPWLNTETHVYTSLDEFFQLADNSETQWEHTVSWIDCITRGGGRGLFMRGNPSSTPHHLEPKGRSVTIPFAPPISLVN
ncbi:MAG: FAD-binding oxidoreductase, partial [Gammaproteobacteria bacterium]